MTLKKIASKLTLGALLLTAYMPNNLKAEPCETWMTYCSTHLEYNVKIKNKEAKGLNRVCSTLAQWTYTDKKDREDLDAVCHSAWTKVKDDDNKIDVFCKIMSLPLIQYNKCPKTAL